MTSITKFILSTVFLLWSCSVLAAFKECKIPLKLSATSEWYPYIYQDKNGASTGVDVSLLTTILHHMGCQLEVFHFPERRALYELSHGHFDIGLGASKNAARSKAFFYSEPYRNERNKFAYRGHKQDIALVKNLQEILKLKKVIAINYAGWYGDEIEKAKAKYESFIYSPTAAIRLKMLHFNRVDIVVDDEIVLCKELLRSTYKEIIIHPIVLFEAPIHFIFNKESVSSIFVKQFNKVLDSMRDDGSLSAHYYKQLPIQCQIHETKEP
ncbi:MAG: transporter substrate-binding domain-containing protein [Colwellia sp.]|nr:transporter substrate-binding domain-containing protein [Colwellia sp.]